MIRVENDTEVIAGISCKISKENGWYIAEIPTLNAVTCGTDWTDLVESIIDIREIHYGRR